jgi:F0F1-type ATP synthase assembly protein I
VSKARQKSGSEDSGTANGRDEFWRLMTRYAPTIGLLPASVLVGYAIGYGLDYLFSTTFLRFVFMILGVVSGIVQLIRILGSDMK